MEKLDSGCVLLTQKEYDGLRFKEPQQVTKNILFNWTIKIEKPEDRNRFYSFGGDFIIGPELGFKIRAIAKLLDSEIHKLSMTFKNDIENLKISEKDKARIEFSKLSLWNRIFFKP